MFFSLWKENCVINLTNGRERWTRFPLIPQIPNVDKSVDTASRDYFWLFWMPIQIAHYSCVGSKAVSGLKLAALWSIETQYFDVGVALKNFYP